MNKILKSSQAFYLHFFTYNFPGGLDGKSSVYNAGDLDNSLQETLDLGVV